MINIVNCKINLTLKIQNTYQNMFEIKWITKQPNSFLDLNV